MSPTLTTYAMLIIAVSLEVMATSIMPKTAQFTKTLPTAIMLLLYAGAFYFLAQTLKTVPIGIAYALWSGFGVVLISMIGWVFYRQALDLAAIIGIGLILSGVVVINLFSKTASH